jgi:hypothetical protein
LEYKKTNIYKSVFFRRFMKKSVMLGILFLFSIVGIFGFVSAVCPANYTEIYTGTGVNGYFSTANLPTNCYAPEKCEILFMLQNKKTKAWTTRVTRDFSQQSDGKWTAYEVHYKKTRSGLNGNTRVSGLSTYDQEDTYLYDDSKNAETEKTKLTVRVTERNPVAVCVNTPTPSPNPPEPTPPTPLQEHRCSNPSQIIMRLSSSTNAHGEFFNGAGNYPIEICYDEIFGEIGSGVRTCTGTNTILKLSSLTNAHAEINTQTNYNNSVCYGDLVCTNRNGSCAIGEEIVVRLSSITNAHLGINNSYDNLICCREGLIPPILDRAYWANMRDVPINSSDLKDWVKLVVPGVNVGDNINYTIYKNRWWWFDQKVSRSSSLTYTIWQSGKNEDGSFSDGTYYFKAVIPNGTEFRSGNLEVSSTQNNSLPVAIMVKPESESKHKINTPVSFEQASYDADDPLKVIWNFGDGSPTKTFEGCNIGTNCNTTYNYSNFGTKSIVLTAEEMGRGRKDSVRRRIFTYAKGINVFAIISKPSLNQVISGTRWVDFEASESYVSECFNSSSLCETESGAEECYEVGEENPLHCYDLSKDDIGTEYELHFRWSFDEGEPLQGTWSDNYDEVVTFSRLFLGANEHFADLRVGYEKL